MMYPLSIALSIAALVSSAAAIADYQKLPQCAVSHVHIHIKPEDVNDVPQRPLFLRAAGQSPCALIDTACVCKSPELATAVKEVLPGACPGEDFARAYSLAYALCPNLKTLFPSASNPILRIHPPATADQEYRIQENGPTPGAGENAKDIPTRQTTNLISYFPETGETEHNHGPAPTARAEHHAHANEYGHEDEHDEPAPYTTPANLAASVIATLSASDFGNTETWKFPTTTPAVFIPKNNTTRTGTLSVPEATGEAGELSGDSVAAAVAVAVIGAVLFGL
jgi:hypothetical protein